jgi:hypothetical protein
MTGPDTALAPRSSSRVVPEMNDRYPGMRGRTQGEMKDNTPAANAATSETFSMKFVTGSLLKF